MEIILKEDIVNLGYKNDIVTVKSGYGRTTSSRQEKLSSLHRLQRKCWLKS